MDVREDVLDIVEECCVKESEVRDDAKLIEDLGLDDLALVELVMALEEQFCIDIPDEEAEERIYHGTFGDLVKYIEEKVEGKSK